VYHHQPYAMFSGEPNGYVRLLLKTDPPTWVAGAWVSDSNGRRSLASTAPEYRDIFLSVILRCDPQTGEFMTDSKGKAVVSPGSMFVRLDDVQVLEFIEQPPLTDEEGQHKAAPGRGPASLIVPPRERSPDRS
jgi:hypothetical protein